MEQALAGGDERRVDAQKMAGVSERTGVKSRGERKIYASGADTTIWEGIERNGLSFLKRTKVRKRRCKGATPGGRKIMNVALEDGETNADASGRGSKPHQISEFRTSWAQGVWRRTCAAKDGRYDVWDDLM